MVEDLKLDIHNIRTKYIRYMSSGVFLFGHPDVFQYQYWAMRQD